uniref:Bursicon-alpha n=1 Tax=Charonia tritonis TaxID=1960912 RepID=A0A1S6JQ08_9CAEN|nr:bursicon-alpha precursor [Charonia tritonis]
MCCWTGTLASQILWLLITMTTLTSPFLQVDTEAGKDLLLPPLPPHSLHELATSAANSIPRAIAPDRYSRQATLMMAASSPRIGVRSSLIGSSDTCQVDPVRMSIRPPRKYAHLCAPTTEISFGCRGGCPSYSRIDARNTTKVLRSCSCCRPTGFGFRLVKMKCEGFSLRTTVKFALGCHCRPCMASVQSVDIQRLRDLLRATSIANIG